MHRKFKHQANYGVRFEIPVQRVSGMVYVHVKNIRKGLWKSAGLVDKARTNRVGEYTIMREKCPGMQGVPARGDRR